MKRIEGVTEKLVSAARDEFFEKGYEGASLRAIAERAGSSKGAIYVRYPDKEALYAAVVDPVVDELCAFFQTELDEFSSLPADTQQTIMNDYADRGIDAMIDYIYDHAAEFKILIATGGARYDAFMHRIVELNSASTYRYIGVIGSDAVTAGRLTPELMHMISSACFSGIFEVVAHDMTREEAKAYVERLCTFFRAGWQAIFDPEFAHLVDLVARMPDAPIVDVAAKLVEARGGAP
ncbi:TetR/AcrR family transcriptional regulator [Eggerthella sinensis]|uniref:TetR/AcrR family transcriptional regulator n=1 Tax=Eggerthella sinensis TaxID=242230 RepID=UPI00248D4EB6|nr:TetR/AcrR family transcriptional regulator [Eggerthella sinensis]